VGAIDAMRTMTVTSGALDESGRAPGDRPRRPDARELDLETLAACRQGNALALRRFVGWYQDLVFAFVSRSLGRGPHVEDLAQEVFLRAFRALPRFEPAGAARLSTWLLTITSRLVIDARRKRRVPTIALEATSPAAAPGTPETERRRQELGRALEAAAAELSPEQRDAFVLAELHDLPMSEIAVILGVPENTVKTRLFRARARLRTARRALGGGAVIRDPGNAWRPQEPSADFADRVVLAAMAERARKRSPSRSRTAAALVTAAACVLLVATMPVPVIIPAPVVTSAPLPVPTATHLAAAPRAKITPPPPTPTPSARRPVILPPCVCHDIACDCGPEP
jgi:RNA polymerase sigma-70 factor (ECF subfamily)